MQKDNVFYPTNSPTSACSSSLEAVSLPDLYDTSYTPATALIDNFYTAVCIFWRDRPKQANPSSWLSLLTILPQVCNFLTIR